VSIFILQVTGGILAIVYQSELAGILEESMQRAMELYPLSGEDSVAARRSWDRVQKNVFPLLMFAIFVIYQNIFYSSGVVESKIRGSGFEFLE